MTSPGLSLLREALLSSNLVSEVQWDNAVKVAHIRKMSLEKVFLEMGIFKADKIAEITEILYGIPKLPVDPRAIADDCLKMLPRDMAVRFRALPLYSGGESRLTVGMVDPTDVDSVDRLTYQLGKDLRVVWISEEDFQAGLRRYDGENGSANVRRILEDFRGQELGLADPDEAPPDESAELLRAMAEEAPVVRLANILMSQAIHQRASDIHLEPGRREARVRVRVDGTLRNLMSLPMNIYPALVSRLKLIAHLDITEHRLPQDGRYACTLEGRAVDMRIATAPALLGEKVVLRIIDAAAQLHRLSDLGYSAEQLVKIEQLVAQPYGMVLVTGPTGSGKSTTLYSALEMLNTLDRNIQTIEDPVERQLEGVCQVQAHSSIGLTFSRVLRSFLRQDPDVIMLGEIRDPETAEISVQAAMTGHLVLSSLHTNDALGTVTRLVDMGVPAYKVASALRGVLAQRLVRRLCSECSQRVTLEPDESRMVTGMVDVVTEAYRPVGCAACNNSGYRGRVVISEVLTVTPRLARFIAEGAHNEALGEVAKAQGFVTLREDAIHKVAAGVTSVQELLRVTMTLETMTLEQAT